MEHVSVCLICLIGLPGSGKSTLARKIETFYNLKYNVIIVNFDEEIIWDDVNTWKNKRSEVQDLVASHIENYLTCTNRNTLLILDDNMFFRSMRYQYYQLARKFGIGFCEIYLSTPLNVCMELNRQRSNAVPDSTIIKMNEKLETPDSSTNKWEKNSLNISQVLSANDWLILDKMIYSCLQTPVKPINSSCQNVVSVSSLHIADIALRKLVSNLVQQRKQTYESSKQYGLELAKKRQQVLQNIRNGKIILPETKSENCTELHYTEFLRPYLLKYISDV